MGYGATQGVKDDENAYREDSAKQIALHAAELVAAGMGRVEAIQKAKEWRRTAVEAVGDVTGVIGVENVEPEPSMVARRAQVVAIAAELMDAARDAAEEL